MASLGIPPGLCELRCWLHLMSFDRISAGKPTAVQKGLFADVVFSGLLDDGPRCTGGQPRADVPFSIRCRRITRAAPSRAAEP